MFGSKHFGIAALHVRPQFSVVQLICGSYVSYQKKNKNSERVNKKDFYPLVVSLGKSLSNTFREKKLRMANYLCSVVHGGSDPVGKSVLDF